MRSAGVVLMFWLAACGEGNHASAPDPPQAAVQTADLTGLYEGRGTGEHKAQMCMIPRPSGDISFGIVAGTPNGTCAGAGEVTGNGNAVRLAMTGDEKCVIEAKVTGTRLALATSVPESCAYYCGPNATLAGAIFEKTGGTSESAMRATDLVGDPLCS